MPKIDCRYEISEERIRSYLAMPKFDRLRSLENLIAFTRLFREAPSVEIPLSAAARQCRPVRRRLVRSGSVRCAHEDDRPCA